MLLRQLVGGVEQAAEVIAHRQVAGLPGHLGQRVQRLAQPFAQQRHVDPGLGQQRPAAATGLVEQRGQHMHRLDDVVVAAHGQRLRIGQGFLEVGGELVHPHGGHPESGAGVAGDTRSDAVAAV